MIPDILLGTSWTIHSLEAVPLPVELQVCLIDRSTSGTTRYLHEIGHQLYEPISHHSRGLKDDFDTESEKRGHLSGCNWTLIQNTNSDLGLEDGQSSLGFLVETHYSKTAYRIVLLLARAVHGPDDSTANLDANPDSTLTLRVRFLLTKGPAKNLKHVLRFLDETFGLTTENSTTQYQPPSSKILAACTRYLEHLDRVDENDVLRQALIKRAIGDLKLGIAISAPDVVSMLKTIDVDVPADAVVSLLTEARKNRSSFLGELAQYLYLRTGLRLPLGVRVGQTEDVELSAPWRVSKVSCSAFVLSTDGRMKLGDKPIESAERLRVDGNLLRDAAWQVFEVMCESKE